MSPTIERRTIELAGLSVPLVEVTGSADGPLLTIVVGRARVRVRIDGRRPAVDARPEPRVNFGVEFALFLCSM